MNVGDIIILKSNNTKWRVERRDIMPINDYRDIIVFYLKNGSNGKYVEYDEIINDYITLKERRTSIINDLI